MLCVFIHFLYGADCFKIRAANFSSVCVVSVSLLVRINYPAAFVLSGNYSPASLSFVSCWSLRWGSRPLLAPVPEALAAAAPVSRIWLLLSDPLLGNFALDLFFAHSCPARRACSVLVSLFVLSCCGRRPRFFALCRHEKLASYVFRGLAGIRGEHRGW